MTGEVRFRRYRAADADAVWQLHERALADAGTDPADVPGADDLRRIEVAYLASGGEFLVGVLPGEDDPPTGTAGPPRVDDGALVAMGGYLPAEAGYADERDVEGPRTAELHRMRVAPAYQRRGIGSRLLAALEDRAAAAGFERLLATTARRQAGSVEFYAAANYEEVGRSTHGEYDLVHFERSI